MNLFIDIFGAFVGTEMLTTDVEVHERVVYGSSYLPVCDLNQLLWCVPHRTRHTRLGPHPSLLRDGVLRHTFHLPVGCWGDDDHTTGCHHHTGPSNS